MVENREISTAESLRMEALVEARLKSADLARNQWLTRDQLVDLVAPEVSGDRVAAAVWVDRFCLGRGLSFRAEAAIAGWLDDLMGRVKHPQWLREAELARYLRTRIPLTFGQSEIEVRSWSKRHSVVFSERISLGALAWLLQCTWFVALSGCVETIVHGKQGRLWLRGVLFILWVVVAFVDSRLRGSLERGASWKPASLEGWIRLALVSAGGAMLMLLGWTKIGEVYPYTGAIAGALIFLSMPLLLARIHRTGIAGYSIRKETLAIGDETRSTLFLGWLITAAGLIACIGYLYSGDDGFAIAAFLPGIAALIYQVAHATRFASVDNEGETALTRAAKGNQPERIRALLSLGADPELKNGWWESPRELFAKMIPPFTPPS